MTDAAYYGLMTGALILAFTRKGDATVGALATGFAASVALPHYRGWPELLAWLSVIDGSICVVMLGIWTRWQSMRAWVIGVIGCGKSALTLSFASGSGMAPEAFALLLNGAFLLQVVIAGGFVDVVGDRVDAVFRRVLPRRYGLLRDGGR